MPNSPLLPVGRVVRIGNAIFRNRSFTLVPLFLAMPVFTWLTVNGWTDSVLLNPIAIGFGIALMVTGEAIRLHVVAFARSATSGRTMNMKAPVLTTTGLYAHVRNPLYLGNFLTLTGLACLTGQTLVVAGVAVLVYMQYFFVIRAEEAFLAREHGIAFQEFVASVPRFIPQRRAWRSGQTPAPARWKRAVLKEQDAIFGVLAMSWLLLTIRLGLASDYQWTPFSLMWLGLLVSGFVVWLVLKRVKKTMRAAATS